MEQQERLLHVFIINPTAGGGKGNAEAARLKEICARRGYDYRIHFTDRETSAKEIAKAYADEEHNGKCVLWAVGGDGTLHSTLNGMVGTDNYLGVIPLGSGNDFVRTLHRLKEPVRRMDVGRINDRYFLNTVCFGLDGQVANNVNRMRSRWIPVSQRYTASIVYTFLTHREKEISFAWNGKKEKLRSTLLTICNGSFYGGGYCIAPDASLDDGQFDFFYAPHVSRVRVIPLFLMLMMGKLAQSKKIHSEHTQSVSIRSEEELECNVDGEVIRGKAFEIRMLPKAIRFYQDEALVDEALAV